MSRTHYSTLGVEPTAGRDAIKGAYYDLRKRFSALKRPTDDQKERLVRINAAWDVLKLPTAGGNTMPSWGWVATRRPSRKRTKPTRRR